MIKNKSISIAKIKVEREDNQKERKECKEKRVSMRKEYR
jgi:hypothetical protein